jgi:uncharacterized protein
MSADWHKEQSHHTIHILSWNDIDEIVQALVQQVCLSSFPDVVIGLQRGGLIPAVMLSHQFEIPLLSLPIRRTVSDQIYAQKRNPQIGTLSPADLVSGKRVLLVDDIVGSGASLHAAFSFV